jgi:hypothetical protein
MIPPIKAQEYADPHLDSLQQAMPSTVDTCATRFDLHAETNFAKIATHIKSANSWCYNGTVAACPLDFKLLKDKTFCLHDDGEYVEGKKLTLSEDFFASYLGKAYQKYELEYVNDVASYVKQKNGSTISRDEHVQKIRSEIEGSFEKGTCYGQIAAVMISNQPGSLVDEKTVILRSSLIHLVFFQAMTNLRYAYKRYVQGEASSTHTPELQSKMQAFFAKNKRLEMMHLQLLANLQSVYRRSVEVRDAEFEQKLRQKIDVALTEKNAQVIRITLEQQNSVHAICLFVSPGKHIFDSLAGMILYENQELLLRGFFTYCRDLADHRGNPLKKVYLEGFKRGSEKIVSALVKVAKENMQNIPSQIMESLKAARKSVKNLALQTYLSTTL